jgi:hypothetical protein
MHQELWSKLLLNFDTFRNIFLRESALIVSYMKYINKNSSLCYSTWPKICMFLINLTMQQNLITHFYHPFLFSHPLVPESHNAILLLQQLSTQHWRTFLTMDGVKLLKLMWQTNRSRQNSKWQKAKLNFRIRGGTEIKKFDPSPLKKLVAEQNSKVKEKIKKQEQTTSQ